MTEKDKEINELRREVKRLEEENDNLCHMVDELEAPAVEKCVRTIYDICCSNEVCKNCCFNRIGGCILTGSPYKWSMKEL